MKQRLCVGTNLSTSDNNIDYYHASSFDPIKVTANGRNDQKMGCNPPNNMKLKFLILGGSNAGKTSILRRYFNNAFDPQRRLPTLGSDFYSKKIEIDDEDFFDQEENNVDGDTIGHIYEVEGMVSEDGQDPACDVKGSSSNNSKNDQRQPAAKKGKRHPVSLSVVCWDTPGRENVVIEKRGNKARYTAVFSDRFFQNVHAALLVYDVTSTTSFTHVLKWHAELVDRIRRMEANGERNKPLPILIVGNKIDLMETEGEGERRPKASVQQRDVLGLLNKNYTGKDYHYEYSASPALTSTTSSYSYTSSARRAISPSNSTSNHHGISTTSNSHGRIAKNRSRFELSTYMGTSSNVDYLEAVLSNEVYRGSYLDSLLKNENLMGPDRDMVLLWCMRNSVQHLDVSAKTGEGIDELMIELVRTALAQMEQQEKDQVNQSLNKTGGESWSYQNERNNELDLHRRYLPKPRKSCFGCFDLPPLQNCWRRGETEIR
jgi:GTPase SAR1 family protein